MLCLDTQEVATCCVSGNDEVSGPVKAGAVLHCVDSVVQCMQITED